MKIFTLFSALVFISNYALADRVVYLRGVDDSRTKELCDLKISYNDKDEMVELEVLGQKFSQALTFYRNEDSKKSCKLGFVSHSQNSNQGVNVFFRTFQNEEFNELAGLELSTTFSKELTSYTVSFTKKSHIPACLGSKLIRPLRNVFACNGLREL